MSKKSQPEIYAADLFCGAGGTSTGLLMASEDLGIRTKLLAINHWDVAIATHTANHPDVEHRCETIDGADPRKIVPGGRLHLLVASPECTHHSNARGGKPMSDQSRATAWHILRWAEALWIDNILIENVREFRDWGPLDEKGRPIKAKRGKLYQQFLSSLRALGYTVSERVLNAADYGDATTRYRLFIQARKGKRPVWPSPTHLPPDKLEGALDLFEAQPWRPAREVIDWGIESRSIYARKKPLADATMARIFAGLRKYSGLPFLIPNYQEREGQAPRTHDLGKPLPTVAAQGWQGLVEPYVVNMKGKSDARDIDAPLPTQTTRQHLYVAQPFLVVLRRNCDAKDVESPVPTLTADGNHVGVCEPYIVTAGGPIGQGRHPHSVEEPLGTVIGENHRALIEPFVVSIGHTGANGNQVQSAEDPLQTVTTQQEMAVVEPFVIPVTHSGGDQRTHDIDAPLPTITTAKRGEFAIVEPFLLPHQHGSSGPENVRSVDDPLPTVTGTSSDMFVAEPYIVKYYEGSDAAPVDEPLPAVTANYEHLAVAEPFLVAYHGSHAGQNDGDERVKGVDEPLPTVVGSNSLGVAEPFIVPQFSSQGPRSVDNPLGALTTTSRGVGLAEPYLVTYNGTGGASSIDEPLDTVTGRDRFALVSPEFVSLLDKDTHVVGYLDIRFRMLQPHELSAAMGFPPDYVFTGNREARVKQIGNAVPVNLAKALCRAILESEMKRPRSEAA